MARWWQAPWPLRLFVVITLGSAVIFAVVIPATPFALRVMFVALEAAVCFFLLRGVRWLWLFMLAAILVGFAMEAVEGSATWYGWPVGIINLALLLHPDTRRFFQRKDHPPVTPCGGGNTPVSV